MSEVTLSFTYGEKGCSNIFAVLEQKTQKSVGTVTREHIAAHLVNLFYSGFTILPVNCGFTQSSSEDGSEPVSSYTAVVYVYTRSNATPFIFKASHGNVAGPTIEEVPVTEIINIDVENSADLQYPINNIISAGWVASVYDSNGNVINPPSFVINNEGVTLPYMVYGALQVVYMSTRYTYNVHISPRPGSTENQLQSFVYLISECGIQYLEVKPDGMGTNCQSSEGYFFGGSNTSFDNEGDDDKPSSPLADKKFVIDYCTREVISES